MDKKNTGAPVISPLVNIAGFIIIVAGVIYAKTIITPVLLALFISIICAQPISWLEKKKLPRWLALVIVIMGLIFLFSGFAFLIGGTVSSFSGNLSKYEESLSTISNSFIQYLKEVGIRVPQGKLSNLVQPAKILEYTASVLNTLLSMMGNTFLIFLIILFTLMESSSFSDKAMAIRGESVKSISYISTILKNIRQYLGIKTLLCLATGFLIFIALLIIGVDYPLLWAMIAAVMNYIPNIGSILATVPTALFALVTVGFGGAVWTLVSSMIIHNILGNIIEPRIIGKGLGLSTLVVFLSLLFWGFILGLVGMFLSVPITMTIKIILEQNEKTKWIALLLGTPAEAESYVQSRKLKEDNNQKNPL